MSQVEIAARAGIGRSTLVNIEAGRRNPVLSTIFRIADALEVDISDLFEKP